MQLESGGMPADVEFGELDTETGPGTQNKPHTVAVGREVQTVSEAAAKPLRKPGKKSVRILESGGSVHQKFEPQRVRGTAKPSLKAQVRCFVCFSSCNDEMHGGLS